MDSSFTSHHHDQEIRFASAMRVCGVRIVHNENNDCCCVSAALQFHPKPVILLPDCEQESKQWQPGTDVGCLSG